MGWLPLIFILAFVAYSYFSSTKDKKRVTYNDSAGNKVTETLNRRQSRQKLNIEKPENYEITPEIGAVLNKFENTSENIFLTGKAGTGKSTLLRYFRATTKKNHAVVAPTGVAAINVQGQTIHSFFGFGTDITTDRVMYARADKLNLMRNLETLIIDEISMVRADLLDCIDVSLRKNRRSNLPFGGVQIIAIGDPYQLPPVVTNSEKEYIRKVYGAPYFFNAKCYNNAHFHTLELTKIYRQQDRDFIDVLNAIRAGEMSPTHIDFLNKSASTIPHESSIKLVTTNQLAMLINNAEMRKLPGEAKEYLGQIIGDFNERATPTDIKLYLKEGARVILLNNDKKGRWVNGDVATIIGLAENSIRVKFDDDNTYDDVDLNEWQNIKFVFDEEEGKIIPEIVGRFIQLPVKLAWAMTIHKSQGKTYDHVHIDFGTGTFAPGQAYVALSRCTSLSGLSFAAPIMIDDVITDVAVKTFMKSSTQINIKQSIAPQQVNEKMAQKSVTQSDINKLFSFMGSPEKYATGTTKAKDKVKDATATFNLIKGQLNNETQKKFINALEKYNSTLHH